MVEVVHGANSTAWLVALVEGLLFGAGEGNKQRSQQKKLREDVLERCHSLVAAMIEILLQLDEGHKPVCVGGYPTVTFTTMTMTTTVNTMTTAAPSTKMTDHESHPWLPCPTTKPCVTQI